MFAIFLVKAVGCVMRRQSSYWRHFIDVINAVAFIFLLALIAAKINEGNQTEVTGRFVVIDGDTLMLDGERLRLDGIDAPELGQVCKRAGRDWPCGQDARKRLASLVEGQAMTCRGDRLDKYRRLLVRCLAGGNDIAALMVQSGFAVAYGGYAGEEKQARGARAGIWAGEFEMPEGWRARRGEPRGEIARGSFLCGAIGVFCEKQEEEIDEAL